MSDEKNVNSGDSADKAEQSTPAQSQHPVSAALSRAEEKAAKVKAKVDAKLEKARAKEAANRAKAEAKTAAEADKTHKAQQEANAKAETKVEKARVAQQKAEAEQKAKDDKKAAKTEKKPTASPAPVAENDKSEKTEKTVISEPLEKSAADSEKNEAAPAPKADQPVAQQKSQAATSEAAMSKTETPAPAKQEPAPATAAGSTPETAAKKDAESSTEEPKVLEAKAEAATAGTAAAATAAASKATSEKNQAPEQQGPEDQSAAKRRRKLEKVRAAEAAKEEQANKSKPATPAPAVETNDKKVSARRRKLEKARVAASKDAATAGTRKKTGAVMLSLAAVIAAGAVVAGGSIIAPKPAESTLPAAVTNLPAGDATSICAPTPQLLKGVDGTDPQFAAGAKKVSSNVRAIAVSDLAKRVPGSWVAKLDGSSPRNLTERIKEAEAAEARGADDAGQTGRVSKVSTLNNVDGVQAYSLQPLGSLASEGSALRSYQASDGDLEGLAMATCQAPASNWRFTGLQTNTGSTSVMHVSNPTHTTAQVSLQLRGPDGLIDTPTLQNIVIAPGEDKALVLGGYAQNMNSVSADVTSVGGKITASVQQAALRGLTPSGVDFVGPNASASNTQVIPGVWIDSKENISSLSKDDKSLVPQLHVSATGSSGAGYKVKVLGENGEVAASFDENLAAASNATNVVDLKQLAGGYYTVVVEADAPVTAAVRMVRGANPKDSSDTAWAASSNVLAGTQAMPVSANGTGKFVLAAVDSDSSVEATVVRKDGKLQKAKKLQVDAGSSIVFDPKSVSDDAQAVIFSTDANTYIAQVALGSDRSIAWASMPQANAGRDGIVVNIGG
ncbi:DUF5719 family protein [Glutamicibacter sp. JC586]|uniref:DUF5719 family protein n=1 Tax=Glutamicibacter sp. JC586 TaxID=2590552 RepID=UPI00135B058E|nr:DUF5719 family protein [Glutamicibacter sp. JC586]